jgi:hypothetical protein
MGKLIDLNDEKMKRAGGDEYNQGWDAAQHAVQLIIDFMNSDASEETKAGFEGGIMCILPNDVLLDEVAYRMQASEVEE